MRVNAGKPGKPPPRHPARLARRQTPRHPPLLTKSANRPQLSPEQICAYLRKHYGITLHHSTVYHYLHQDKSNGNTLWQHLRICNKPYRKRYGSTWQRDRKSVV